MGVGVHVTTEDKPKKGHLFKKGSSGNPEGRPKGSKNRSTIIKEAIESNMIEHVEGEAMSVLQKTIDMAKEGDTTCIKILMDRLWPVSKQDKADKADKSKIIINVTTLESDPATGSGVTIEASQSPQETISQINPKETT